VFVWVLEKSITVREYKLSIILFTVQAIMRTASEMFRAVSLDY